MFILSGFDNVYELYTGYTKVFVIKRNKTILVDTGSGPISDRMMACMSEGGFIFADQALRKELKQGSLAAITGFLQRENVHIDLIVCTHWHGDHAGNLKKLKEMLGVPAAMHPADIPFVEGEKEIPFPDRIPEDIRRHVQLETCRVDRCLADGEYVAADVRVIHLPGHTPGSIGLLVNDELLISGDCLIGRNEMNPKMGLDELNLPMKLFCMDYDAAVESLHRLLDFKFDAILTGHGVSVSENGRIKLEAVLRNVGRQV